MKLVKGLKKLLTLTKWRQFFKVLSKKEKLIFFIFLFLFLSSLAFLSINFYFKNTKIVPAEGGIYREGLVGFPTRLNPIYAPANDVDRDLTELLFSGLMKYDLQGRIVPDLAKDYQIFEEGKIYEFYLRENLFWSDHHPFTSEDIIFTINLIQNPETKSPLRTLWLGVEVEKISGGVRFKLKKSSATFLENTTLKIIPKHLWKDILPQNFPFSIYNLKPVTSGPYQLKNLSQTPEGKIISLDLVRNPKYYGDRPRLQKISFRFFDNRERLMESYKKGEIKGFVPEPDFNLTSPANLYSFSLPRYFALFLNPEQSKPLSEKEVREALNYATNKKEIIEQVLGGKAKTVDSPILPKIYKFENPSKVYQFDLEKAKEILEKAGFLETEKDLREKTIKEELAFQFKTDLKFGSRGKEVKELQKCLAKDKEIYSEGKITGYFGKITRKAVIKFQEKYSQNILNPFQLKKGTGQVRKMTRKKLNEICFEKPEQKIPLKFSLVTVSQPTLMEVASLIGNQWKKLGVDLEIKTFDIQTLEKEIIKPRDYQLLLFGEVLGFIPDPFPFWHSSQKKDPGLNLASFENKNCDKLLEEVRQSLNEIERKKKLEEFQDLLIEEAAAVFLYNPDYLYLVSKQIKGIKEGIISDPSKRFSNIEDWYIKTKRVWK